MVVTLNIYTQLETVLIITQNKYITILRSDFYLYPLKTCMRIKEAIVLTYQMDDITIYIILTMQTINTYCRSKVFVNHFNYSEDLISENIAITYKS